MWPKAKQIHIKVLRNQQVIAEKGLIAESFWERLRGLIGRKDFRAGEGLWFESANNIHMWFMSIPIDVVFLKKADSPFEFSPPNQSFYKITSLRPSLRPWRVLPVWGPGATETLELPEGTIEKCDLKVGDEVVCIS